MEKIDKYYKYLVNNYKVHDLVIDHGEGSYLYDNEGKRYLDFTSGIGVNSLGYGNELLTETLITQIKKIIHCSNIFINDNAVDLAEKLVDLSGYSRVFFSNSGAESNECAIKLARKYSYDKYGYGRDKIITLKNSFHGRTLTTLKATGQEKFHKYFYPFPEGFIYAERNNIKDLILKVKQNNVCAIMLEPIQGEGGVIPLNKEYISKVAELCKEKDIILMFDEVQCGIGRTGTMFAYENYRVKPDIVTLAKGIGGGVPIGAVLCNEKTAKIFNYGDHGSTFGGNPLATAAALTVINEVSRIDFINEVKEKSKYIFHKLRELKSEDITDIRGSGLMIGIEVKGDLNDYVNKAISKGLLLLTAGNNTIRLLPPLTITKDEIDEGVEILKEII